MGFEATSNKHRGELGGGWTLCIGAGISQGLVPTWPELTRLVVNQSFGANLDAEQFKHLGRSQGWSLDSWIQASANQFRSDGRDLNAFHELLAETLYGELRQSARTHGLEHHLSIALKNPRQVGKRETIRLAEFFESHYGGTSLLALAKVLIECAKAGKLPYAIITFNADTLLHTVIELLQRRDHFAGPPPHSHPKYYFKTILRSLEGAPKGKTPIYHIHGAIKPEVEAHVTKGHDSRDKLIFLEEDFLRIATNSSSWPEVTFMFHSQVSRLVFAGLSMSDPNIRRWLSSAYAGMVNDVHTVAGVENFEASHLWITAKPIDPIRAQAQAVGLSHLGVRPAWLADWGEIGSGLKNLLAI